jgi:hypothetical protein
MRDFRSQISEAEVDGADVSPEICRKISVAGSEAIRIMHSPVIHTALESGKGEGRYPI